MTQGAVMRSWRSAARKVSVRQRPCGTLATRRAPRLQRPCRRGMLVLAQVDKYQSLGVSPTLICLPLGAAASDVRAILLAGVQRFFKVIPAHLKKRHTAPQLAGVPRSASLATTA